MRRAQSLKNSPTCFDKTAVSKPDGDFSKFLWSFQKIWTLQWVFQGCIYGFMSNTIKKPLTVSSREANLRAILGLQDIFILYSDHTALVSRKFLDVFSCYNLYYLGLWDIFNFILHTLVSRQDVFSWYKLQLLKL